MGSDLILPSRSRLKKIIGLGLPIVAGMTSQNVLNLVDTAMVGSLGDVSLAAVGVGGFFAFMVQALFMGLSAGVQSIAARRWGEGNQSVSAVPLNGGILIALFLGIPFVLFLYYTCHIPFAWLVHDAQVFVEGLEYVKYRLPGIIAIGINFSFRGYWSGIGRPILYTRTIVFMHIINVILNYTLIYGHFGFPAMGVAGSAVGTSIALMMGSMYYMYLAKSYAYDCGFAHKLPSRTDFRCLLKVAIPSSLQIFFFAMGFTVEFWIIGMIGTAELAASNVLIHIMLVCILPGVALGMAAGSLVGQELGKGNSKEATRWGWDVVKVGVVFMTLLGVPMMLFPEHILSLFIHDLVTLQLAITPLVLVGASTAVEAFALILINALLGAGYGGGVMRTTVLLQWAFFLPLAFLIGPTLGFGLLGVWITHVIYRTILAFAMFLMWQQGKWAEVQL